MKRLKILQIITRLSVGGASAYCILLSSELKKRGHQVLLVYGRNEKNEKDMIEDFDSTRTDCNRIQVNTLCREIDPVDDLKTLFTLVRLIRKERPDIVHTHTSKAGILGRLAAVIAGVPVRVHSFHGTIFEGYFSRWRSIFFVFLEKVASRISHCFLVDTDLIKQDLISRSIARADKIRVLPLGMDLDKFKDLSPFAGRMRSYLGIAPNIKVVGMVARLVPIKGVQYFLEAARKVSSEYKNVHFLIAGDGDLRGSLEESAVRLGIKERVSFLGFWKELREFYADIDLFVLSSLSEGCPIAILEAMAAGKPVVASNVGGVPDVVSEGATGSLVPSGDAEMLAKAILSSLIFPEKSKRLAENARKMVFETFTIEKSAYTTEQVYFHLLNGTNLS